MENKALTLQVGAKVRVNLPQNPLGSLSGTVTMSPIECGPMAMKVRVNIFGHGNVWWKVEHVEAFYGPAY